MAWWNPEKKIKLTEAQLQSVARNAAETAMNNLASQQRGNPSYLATQNGGVSGTYDGSDTLHDIYAEYGYPEKVEFQQFWNMYRRFGIARTGVELPVDTGWMNDPVITSDSQEFVSEFKKLAKRTKLWSRLRALDTYQRVGQYAGLFLRIRDGKSPDKELSPVSGGEANLFEIIPMYENQLYVKDQNNDPTSEEYNMPTMYQYRGGITGTRQSRESRQFDIHPSRVIPVSETALAGGIWGISSLEAPFNSLMDLRKIIGAGGEGFYKNAAANLLVSSEDNYTNEYDPKELEEFDETITQFNRNRMRKHLLLPGFKADALYSDLAQPKEFFENALNDVSAGFKIPATILIGKQTGRLASAEDSKHFLSTCKARQHEWQSEMISMVIDRFIEIGILPQAEYKVNWEDIMARSDEQRIMNAEKMTSANERNTRAGQPAVFTPDEIREIAGFDMFGIDDDGKPEGDMDPPEPNEDPEEPNEDPEEDGE